MSKKQKVLVLLSTALGAVLLLPLFAHAAYPARYSRLNANLISNQLFVSPEAINLSNLNAGVETSFSVEITANPRLATSGAR